MEMAEDNSPLQQYIPCRAELTNPGNDWEKIWNLARSKGLDPEMTTFLQRLLHRLLPTQDRVHRIVRNTTPSPNCKLCNDEVIEDLEHAFFYCNFNSDTGTLLRRSISSLVPSISASQILTLTLEVDPVDEFPCVWLISHTLFFIWSGRVEKKRIRLFQIRADLEARASLLRKTRFEEISKKIENLIQVCFDQIIYTQ